MDRKMGDICRTANPGCLGCANSGVFVAIVGKNVVKPGPSVEAVF